MPITGLRFAYQNLLAKNAPTLTPSSSELVNPINFIYQDWPSKPWRTVYQTFIVTAANNKLRFTYGASNFTATIPSGQYRPANLIGAVTDAMNAAASVATISGDYGVTVAGAFTIIRSGASTFSLLCATFTTDAANKEFSIFPTLGFDCSSDKTGAGSGLGYSAGATRKSTWGRFEITASNNVFKFDIGGATLTATLTAANYSIMELCAELKYRMDVAATVTDFDVSYSESTDKFTIKKGAGTFNIRTASNTLMTTLGYTAADKTGALTYTAENPKIHTSEEIVADFGSAVGVDVVAVLPGNYSSGVTMTIQANTTNSWASPPINTVLAYDANNPNILILYFVSTQSYRFWRLLIQDPANTDGFVSIGVWTLAPVLQMSQAAPEMEDGKAQLDDASRSEFGNSAGTNKNMLKIRKPLLRQLPQADKDNLEAMFDAVGTFKSFLVSLDVDNRLRAESIWMTLMNRPTFARAMLLGNTPPVGYSVTIPLMESK